MRNALAGLAVGYALATLVDGRRVRNLERLLFKRTALADTLVDVLHRVVIDLPAKESRP